MAVELIVVITYHCFADNATFVALVITPANEFGEAGLLEGLSEHCGLR